MTPIPRREFLRTSLITAFAGPAVLAACSSDGPVPTASPTASPTSLTDLMAQRTAAGARQKVQIFPGGGDYVAGETNYIGFAITTPDANPLPITGREAMVWLSKGVGGEGAPLGPFTAAYHAYARPDGPPPIPQGVNAVDAEFPAPGIWQMLVEAEGTMGLALGQTAIQVLGRGQAKVPLVGQDAIPTRTPTTGRARGVDPICTRENDDGKPDPCDFHRATLAGAMKGDVPVAFSVGTPKFCESRTCGPNLEELITVAEEAGDRATFVHAEVYVDDEPDSIARQKTTAAFREWHLASEPWLFLIKEGKVARRFEGPITAPQIRAALQPLLA